MTAEEPPDPPAPARLDTDALNLSPDGVPVGNLYIRGKARIGEGSTGQVFRGQRIQDGSPVAVKLLKPGTPRDQVMRQLRAHDRLKRIRHPNLVAVHDVIVHGDDFCALIMELIEGEDLRSAMRRLDVAEAGQVLSQITDGLAELHAHGVVHRDIKPENVLLEWQDGRPLARLTDFGLAKAMDDVVTATRENNVPGTLLYLAPEMRRRRPATFASDVYALGVVAYELFVGDWPPEGSPVPRPDGIGDVEWQVIERCLAPDPAERPAAVELACLFAALASGPLPVDAPLPQPRLPSVDYLVPAAPGDQPVPATATDPSPAPAAPPVPVLPMTPVRRPPDRRKEPLVAVPTRPATERPAPVVPPRTRRTARRWAVAVVSCLAVAAAGVAGVFAGHHPSSHHRPSTAGRVLRYLPVTATSPAEGRVSLSYPNLSRQPGFQTYLVFRDDDEVDHGPNLGAGYTDPFVDREQQHCYRVAVWFRLGSASPPPRGTPTRTCLVASGPKAGTATPSPIPR
jgi:serine/threonine-protein kinase